MICHPYGARIYLLQCHWKRHLSAEVGDDCAGFLANSRLRALDQHDGGWPGISFVFIRTKLAGGSQAGRRWLILPLALYQIIVMADRHQSALGGQGNKVGLSRNVLDIQWYDFEGEIANHRLQSSQQQGLVGISVFLPALPKTTRTLLTDPAYLTSSREHHPWIGGSGIRGGHGPRVRAPAHQLGRG